MTLNRQKTLQSAERLLKQGKVQAALAELQRLAEYAPNDLLTLNRMGDLLARQGRHDEATTYYERIAEQFTRQGFYPKAIAIRKKILRLHPQRAEVLVQLGELYLHHRVPGEARNYLIQAADGLLKERKFSRARTVYEKLVAAEPDDPRHRVRLAETRAAAGETEAAAKELAKLGWHLIESGKAEDAERAFRRGRELDPQAADALIGIATCMFGTGRVEESLGLLTAELERDDRNPTLLGEIWRCYEAAGREQEACDVLRRPAAVEIPPPVFERVFETALARGTAEALWKRLDPVLDAWAQKGGPQRVVAILEQLGELEKKGHLPALTRLYERVKFINDRPAITRVLERLHKSYRLHQMNDAASRVLEDLRQVAPKSPLLAQAPAPAVVPAAAAERVLEIPEEPSETAVPPKPFGVQLSAAEAPAVPLQRGDEEFVTGGMTQTEILEKYGLHDQALAQIQEVTSRFPGHVPAQEKRVALLRDRADARVLQRALLDLALACRAAGEVQEAARAIAEAQEQGDLDPATARVLEQLGLRAELRTPAQQLEQVLDTDSATPADDGVIPIEIESTSHAARAEAVVIDFDTMDEEDEVASPAAVPARPAVAPPAGPAAVDPVATKSKLRPPSADMLDEIRTYIGRGMLQQAARRVEALRELGYGNSALDELEREIRAVAPPTARFVPPEDDDDLSSITSALEDELFGEQAAFETPEPDTEQSLQEVFAAFKDRVAEQVDHDDFRTHYDLGIGYKEMGLVEEAIREFAAALRSSELARDASTMLAICHRELDRPEEAIRWYRRAIEASGNDAESLSGLRYDLAEVLLLNGDRQSALDTFRDVCAVNPAFRDVESRIAELESASHR